MSEFNQLKYQSMSYSCECYLKPYRVNWWKVQDAFCQVISIVCTFLLLLCLCVCLGVGRLERGVPTKGYGQTFKTPSVFYPGLNSIVDLEMKC